MFAYEWLSRTLLGEVTADGQLAEQNVSQV